MLRLSTKTDAMEVRIDLPMRRTAGIRKREIGTIGSFDGLAFPSVALFHLSMRSRTYAQVRGNSFVFSSFQL